MSKEVSNLYSALTVITSNALDVLVKREDCFKARQSDIAQLDQFSSVQFSIATLLCKRL